MIQSTMDQNKLIENLARDLIGCLEKLTGTVQNGFASLNARKEASKESSDTIKDANMKKELEASFNIEDYVFSSESEGELTVRYYSLIVTHK